MSYPSGEYRLLTHDTNSYSTPSLAADGRTLVANQSKLTFEVGIAPAENPSELKAVPVSSQVNLWRWDWMTDGRLILPQGGDLKAVSTGGQESVVLSDPAYISDQVSACGDGKYIVLRRMSRANTAAVNLWRMDANGSNATQLTTGQNDREPVCAADGKWVYFTDQTEKRHIKRVSPSGGNPETIVEAALSEFELSPDGRTIASVEVSEDNHKLMIRFDPTDGGKTSYGDADSRMRSAPVYTPDGKSIVYVVREKGVDNLWEQSLDGRNRKQLTFFSKDLIFRYSYSKDGKQIAIERGNVESDAFLFHDSSK
jgi:TolB protein